MNHKKPARRRAICRFIRQFVEEHGYSPTLREMADSVGITSMAHITYWRDLLAFEGLLTYELYIARSIRLTEAGEALAREEEESDVSTAGTAALVAAPDPEATALLSGAAPDAQDARAPGRGGAADRGDSGALPAWDADPDGQGKEEPPDDAA